MLKNSVGDVTNFVNIDQGTFQPIIKDKVVDAVRKDLLDRSNVGIIKYNTTLDQNKGDLRYWLNHAYEECLDQANYLKRAIMEIDND